MPLVDHHESSLLEISSKASGAVPVFKAANVVGPGETLALESESLRSKPLVNYQPGLFTSRRRSMSAHSCIRALNQALTPQQSRSAEQMRRCQIVPRAGCGLGGWACARSKPLSDGGDLSSDGALILLRRSDQHIGLSRAAAAAYGDARDPRRIEHRLRDLRAAHLRNLLRLRGSERSGRATRRSVDANGRWSRRAASVFAHLSRMENLATRAQAGALQLSFQLNEERSQQFRQVTLLRLGQ